MALTPKRKAMVFASVLLLASTALVGTAVAAAGSAFQPFMTNQQYGNERGLTRDHHRGLGIMVGQMVGDKIEPIPGATVTLVRKNVDRQAPLDSKETNARGAAVFNVRPGVYEIAVAKDTLVSAKEVPVRSGLRLMVVFDESGDATWRAHAHKPMERRGDTFGLMVRVGEKDGDKMTPVEGATVTILRYTDRTTTERVDSQSTNARGMAAFQLHRGHYMVKVTVGDVTNETRVHVDGGKIVAGIVDGDDIRFRVGDMQDRRGADRPSASPSPSRPRGP